LCSASRKRSISRSRKFLRRENKDRGLVRQVDIAELSRLAAVVRSNGFHPAILQPRRRADKVLNEKFIDVALPDLTPIMGLTPVMRLTRVLR
jgi:hypothetical protein